MSQNLRHKPDYELFHEEQRFTQWWIRLLVVAVTLLVWWAFIQQILLGKPAGTNPGPDWFLWIIMVVLGVGFPLFMFTLKLETRVYPGRVDLRFAYLIRRRISMKSIVSFRAREYRPLMEFGGWGVRWVPGKGVAFNTGGNKGVEVNLDDGKMVMIGSQEEMKLEQAIRQAKDSGFAE